MAAPSYTYTLTNGTTADASQVMQDFNDILNGVSDGTKDLTLNALTANGAANLKAAVTLGASSANLLTVNGALNTSVVLNTDNAFDIGSTTKGLRALYLGANSQRVKLAGSASMSASWTLTLPVTAGTANYVLLTDGAGVSSWVPITTAAFAATSSTAGTVSLEQSSTGNSIAPSGAATTPNATWNFGRIGKQVTISMASLSVTTTSGTTINFAAQTIPAAYQPSNEVRGIHTVQDNNGTNLAAAYTIGTDGSVTFYASAAYQTFTNGTVCIIRGFSCSYCRT